MLKSNINVEQINATIFDGFNTVGTHNIMIKINGVKMGMVDGVGQMWHFLKNDINVIDHIGVTYQSIMNYVIVDCTVDNVSRETLKSNITDKLDYFKQCGWTGTLLYQNDLEFDCKQSYDELLMFLYDLYFHAYLQINYDDCMDCVYMKSISRWETDSQTVNNYTMNFVDDEMQQNVICATSLLPIKKWVYEIMNAYDLSELDIVDVYCNGKRLYYNRDVDLLRNVPKHERITLEPIERLYCQNFEHEIYDCSKYAIMY